MNDKPKKLTKIDNPLAFLRLLGILASFSEDISNVEFDSAIAHVNNLIDETKVERYPQVDLTSYEYEEVMENLLTAKEMILAAQYFWAQVRHAVINDDGNNIKVVVPRRKKRRKE